MRRTLFSPTVHIPSARYKAKIAARVLIALTLLTSGVARPSSAAIIYVTTLVDKISDSGGCSFKEAIYSSNLRTNSAISYYTRDSSGNIIPVFVTTQCVPGDGNDIIVLPAGQLLQMNFSVQDSTNPTGPTATQIITSTITIEGYGATLQWAPGCSPGQQSASCATTFYSSRLFAVAPSGSLTLHNLYIQGFSAQGGNGTDGGGGGMGAGGAVYVQGGTLFVENSTFDSNGAVGGKGDGSGSGNGDGSSGGGGGGVGGSGGFGVSQANSGSSCGGFGSGGGGGGGAGFNTQGGWAECLDSFGASGGGTVFPGNSFNLLAPLAMQGVTGAGGVYLGGYTCGGNGGAGGSAALLGAGQPGQNAPCPGGGGGGGGWGLTGSGNGAIGSYGGGGGGGADAGGNGGNGGFGGGGGAGWSGFFGNTSGGTGGFGGGGGAGPNGSVGNGNPGLGGGPYGGNADHENGGGGAGLGGAIFNDSGGVRISNSTFVNNYVRRGVAGGGAADNGGDGGGAIFTVNGHLTVTDVTIANNQSTGSGGGIVVIQTDSTASTILNLYDTIIFNNGSMINGALTNAANECWVIGAGIGVSGAGNLIQNNNNCDGVVTTGDPQLGSLQNNGGFTPTMAIPETSAAFNAADPSTSLSTDQRNDPRPEMGGYDIGAYELCIARNPNIVGECSGPLGVAPPTVPLTIQVSPAGAGITSPAPGTYSEYEGTIVTLTASVTAATANCYTFTGWTGNVGNQQGQLTPIVMLEPQTVTANFTYNGCVAPINDPISVGQLGEFVTATQLDWSGSDDAISPLLFSNLLTANFNQVYASTSGEFILGLTGSPTEYFLLFDSSGAVLQYLPTFGPAAPLNVNFLDPTASPAGVFGGEVVALKLNTDFSNAGFLGSTTFPFGNLVLTKMATNPPPYTTGNLSTLNGQTVSQFLAIANTCLAAGPCPYAINDVDALAFDLNVSYENGIASAFAKTNLALPGGYVPPSVNPTVTPNAGVAPLPAQFAAKATDAAGKLLTYLWNFGDGSTSTAASPSHTYTTPGIYTAQLTVSDGVAGYKFTLYVTAYPFVPATDTFSNGEFVTYSQGSYAGPQDVPAAFQLVNLDYNTAFASTSDDLLVGVIGVQNEYFLDFDNNGSILTYLSTIPSYLPTSGPVGTLNTNSFDPTIASAGLFGGDVVALTFNITFNNTGFLHGTSTIPFGSLVLANMGVNPPGTSGDLSSLNGVTVAQFLAMANTCVGGGPCPLGLNNIGVIANDLNLAFDGGTLAIPGSPDAFAETYLALPKSVPLAPDVTTEFTVTRGGYTYNFGTGRFAQTVTVTNNSTNTIAGPISLILDNPSSDATLFNATGTTSFATPIGSPYLTTTGNLAPGQATSFVLQFTDPTKGAITYTTRVLAGTGAL